MRKEDSIKQRIREAVGQQPVDEEKKERSIALLGDKIAQKQIAFRWTFAGYIKNHLLYISISFWAVQGALLLCCMLLLGGAVKSSQEWFLPIAASLLPLSAALGIGEAVRGNGHKMWEMEQTYVYSLKEMLFLRLLICGLYDLALLLLLSLGGSYGSVYSFGWLALCLALPFTASAAVYLAIVIWSRNSKLQNTLLSGSGILLSFLWGGLWQGIFELEKARAGVMAALLTAAVVLLILELRILSRRIERGDLICWN